MHIIIVYTPKLATVGVILGFRGLLAIDRNLVIS